MGNFTTSLITEYLPNEPYKRKLYKRLIYKYNSKTITVPKGFICDGASIPKVAWSIIGSPFSGRYVRAAFIHDFYYRIGKVSRLETDKIFLLAMADEEVSWLKRRIMYRFVRTFAWIPWNRYRKAEI